MNLLRIIYLVGALAVGFFMGVTVELMIDARTVRDYQEQNRKLRLENAQLRNEVKHEVIEIVDNRTTSQDIDFSQNW